MKATAVEPKKLYNPLISKILKVDVLTATEKKFEIILPDNKVLKHKPGQFVEVSIFGYGEAPISISSSPTREPAFELAVRKTGRLTNRMHLLEEGHQLGIRGPFGNGFDVEAFQEKDILFICGGIGLAPLKSLIEYTIVCKCGVRIDDYVDSALCARILGLQDQGSQYHRRRYEKRPPASAQGCRDIGPA